MDEQRVIDLMRVFFAEMHTKLVTDVVKELAPVHDAVSDDSSEKDTVILGEEDPSVSSEGGRLNKTRFTAHTTNGGIGWAAFRVVKFQISEKKLDPKGMKEEKKKRIKE